jgi:hypothetical protein
MLVVFMCSFIACFLNFTKPQLPGVSKPWVEEWQSVPLAAKREFVPGHVCRNDPVVLFMA